jgi:hypothetical protein
MESPESYAINWTKPEVGEASSSCCCSASFVAALSFTRPLRPQLHACLGWQHAVFVGLKFDLFDERSRFQMFEPALPKVFGFFKGNQDDQARLELVSLLGHRAG